jgi:hypothetical protein
MKKAPRLWSARWLSVSLSLLALLPVNASDPQDAGPCADRCRQLASLYRFVCDVLHRYQLFGYEILALHAEHLHEPSACAWDVDGIHHRGLDTGLLTESFHDAVPRRAFTQKLNDTFDAALYFGVGGSLPWHGVSLASPHLK